MKPDNNSRHGNGSEYDELYGMNLDEYCEAHGTTLANLIKKTETDIAILKKKLSKEWKGGNLTDLGNRVYSAIQKKEAHKQRLEDWGYRDPSDTEK